MVRIGLTEMKSAKSYGWRWLAWFAAATSAAAVVVAVDTLPHRNEVTPTGGASPKSITYRPVAHHPAAEVVDDLSGQPVDVSCGTCHATRAPNPSNGRPQDLDLFHQGLSVQHGSLACLSCHNNENYDTLRLASGVKVDFEDAMTLCSQCHGPQRRDYDHGAHGGMNGYWDLTKGGRVRNTCMHCHDPHVPKYQQVYPAPPPADRFMTARSEIRHE